NLDGNFQKGYATFYHPSNPFQGKQLAGNIGITLQPNQHINVYAQYNGVQFNRASNGEHVFTVHIVNLQGTYQFDKHFRVRAIEQFDTAQHVLLTDLPGMYEPVPCIVFSTGYVSLSAHPPALPRQPVPISISIRYLHD